MSNKLVKYINYLVKFIDSFTTYDKIEYINMEENIWNYKSVA